MENNVFSKIIVFLIFLKNIFWFKSNFYFTSPTRNTTPSFPYSRKDYAPWKKIVRTAQQGKDPRSEKGRNINVGFISCGGSKKGKGINWMSKVEYTRLSDRLLVALLGRACELASPHNVAAVMPPMLAARRRLVHGRRH